MKVLNKVIAIVLSLFLLQHSYAQDSSLAKWNIKSDRLAEGVYEITYSTQLQKGYYLYDKNATHDLSGFTTTMPDSSYSAKELKISTGATTINDPTFENASLSVYKDSFAVKQTVKIAGTIPSSIRVKLYYEIGAAETFSPEEQTVTINLDGGIPGAGASGNRMIINTLDLKNPVNNFGIDSSTVDTKSKGYWGIFILGFLGGLIALLTPCVFPMIPLTVSFFTKRAASRQSGIKNAFLYGFFIFLIYVLLSLPFHFLDKLNPEILNNISTNVYLNVFFFVVFVVFAFSFFGFYEITLPGSMSSSVDSKSGMGTIVGIFFMALTLALVSFSCTGPILGSLLAGSLSSDGGAMQLTAGMAGFGLALALPFALFSLFPNWLNSLPKSGGWLNTVKVVLGFLELALALKFLSNADLVKHWGLLKREVFIGIWVIIGIFLTLYLFGKLKFPHDNPDEKIGPVRKGLGIITLLFTLYLIPGLTNTKWANLSLISGFPPPLYHSIYQKNSDCILNLNCTRDYETGVKMAKEQNKPMLIDFTGYACVNCRRMEENVWSKDNVYKLMKDSFIVVSLYVDDKKVLPPAQQFEHTSKDGSKREITTVGDKWATFETENFISNAQPWYAIVSPDERLMNKPVGYVPDANEYLTWLRNGLEGFKKGSK